MDFRQNWESVVLQKVLLPIWMTSCRSLFGLNLCVILTRKTRDIHSLKAAFIPRQMKHGFRSILATAQVVLKNNTLLSELELFVYIRMLELELEFWSFLL